MKPLRAVLVALILVVASGCSTTDDRDAAVDAEHYYDSYSEQGDSATGNSGAAGTSRLATGSGSTGADGTTGSDAGYPSQGPTQPRSHAPTDPETWEDNTFVDAGTSGFLDPRVTPLSTFSTDVDTGSYRVARALLADGQLPPAAAVRVEEWVNSFDSGFPSPESDDLELRSDQARATSVAWSTSPSTTDRTRLVRIGLQARDVAESEWPPVALTMVVDTSGSMDIRERLGLVKASLALLVQHLRPSDTIAIVTYETNATPLLRPTRVGQAEEILDAIDRLRAGGSTNLEAGLLLGYDQAREAYVPGAANVVLLASDGVANVGVTDGGRLASAIRDNGRRGIHLVTVGYGMGNYNDHLMEQLADRGDGFYAYVDTFDEARRLFVEDLRSTLTPVARDAKVQVEFDPATVAAYRLVGYENRALADEDFDDPGVDAGEIGAGHRMTALYEVRPTARAEEGAHLGTVRVRWHSVDPDRNGDGDGDQRQDSLELRLGSDDEPSGTLGVAAAVAHVAQIIKGGEIVTDDDTLDLAGLQRRVDTLVEQDAAGATELASLLRDVSAAR